MAELDRRDGFRSILRYEGGDVQRVRNTDGARHAMVTAYFEWHSRGKRVALVSGTNSEADAINESIQQRRIDKGELDATVLALGMGEQRILVGDTVQTLATARAPESRTVRSGWFAGSGMTSSHSRQLATAASCMA